MVLLWALALSFDSFASACLAKNEHASQLNCATGCLASALAILTTNKQADTLVKVDCRPAFD